MSVDQSSGVVFSRATALEIHRRSDVLLPATDPDWKIFTRIAEDAAGKHKPDQPPRPLTKKALISICRDPALGFVIAKESLGFEPLRHTHRGNWKDWNLYDCNNVRLGAPQT